MGWQDSSCYERANNPPAPGSALDWLSALGFGLRPVKPVLLDYTDYQNQPAMQMKNSFLKVLLTGVFTLGLAVANAVYGQGITSSAISGTVTDRAGTTIAGASVTVVHQPSGTQSVATTRANGQFNLSGLRVGGPYTVTVAAPDHRTEARNDVYLDLGTAASLNFQLGSDVTVLEAYTVESSRDTTFGTGKVGTGTNLSEEDIENAPNLRRNVQDVAKLDSRMALLSLDQGGQLSAQGQNFRFNSFLIDGVQANDPFGLNSNGFSSLRSPIPMEALQGLSVELNPYDVRRAGFTGALLNAVTKSGTNEWKGTLYYEFTNESMRAKNPITGTKDTFEERAYGITVGGPLIKNKLFLQFTYDDFEREAAPPTANFVPDAAQLQQVIARAQAAGNYDAGALSADNIATQKTYLAKLDWNISNDHRLSVTYRDNEGTEPIFPSYTGSTQTSLSNYWYTQPRITESYTAQLFSSWTPDFRTEASFSVTDYDGSPSNNGTPYPEVTVQGLTGVRRDTGATITNGSIRLGTEFSRQLNELTTKTTTGSFIGEYSMGEHTVTFGVDGEQIDYNNKFVQAYNGSYTFSSLANWVAGTPIQSYTLTKAYAGRTIDEAFAEWQFVMLGFFVQDTWKPSQNLTISAGLRLDYPKVDEAPPYNAAFETAFGMRNDGTPDGNYTISPRLGFSYNLDSERKTQIRGGLGLFQGKNPAVWISNAYSNTGATGNVTLSNPAGAVFNPDPATQTPPPGNPAAPAINLTDPDFKQPTLWKTNIAVDHELPFGGLIFTAEYNYNQVDKAVNTVFLNYLRPTSGNQFAPDGRERYNGPISTGLTGDPFTSVAGRRRVSTFADVFMLTNTDKGESKSVTFALNRPMKNNWAASFSWTHSDATEVSPATSSTASSNYNVRASFNPNEDVASTSNYNIDDRVVASITRTFEFIKRAPTSVTAVYEARTGRPYSWVFRGDANGDGFTFNDLFYVPTGPTDSKVGWYSTAERDAFFAFAEASGLNAYSGTYTPRNSERSPWVQTVDLRFSQTIPLGSRLQTELYVNIINFANWFDDEWGIQEEVPFGYRRAVAGANYDATANGGQGQWLYRFNGSTLDGVPVTVNDTAVSRWQVQVGVRVKF
jgi:hypothetical protein